MISGYTQLRLLSLKIRLVEQRLLQASIRVGEIVLCLNEFNPKFVFNENDLVRSIE